jgi:hypothetical protein
MAAVVPKLPASLTRTRLVVAVVAAGVLGTYAYFAMGLQPLGNGTDEWLYRAPGQATLPNYWPDYYPGPDVRAPLLLLGYVDGAEASLVKTFYNDGPTPITITGIEISPSYLTGALVTIKEAQPAVITGPPPCSQEAVDRGTASLGSCQLNQTATWRGGEFRPIQVSPRQQGLVAIHLLIGNCENNGSGGYEIIDSVQVHYNELGFPHVQAVDVGPYWFQSPDTCPRTGPARP